MNIKRELEKITLCLWIIFGIMWIITGNKFIGFFWISCMFIWYFLNKRKEQVELKNATEGLEDYIKETGDKELLKKFNKMKEF